MGAASSPQEAAKAMERIEQEAARMGVLVEDLLASRASTSSPSDATSVFDAAPLVRDAAEDARAAAPDREITGARRRRAGWVSGDSSQLRQVLANLTRNALTHTAGRHADRAVRRERPTSACGSPCATTVRAFPRAPAKTVFERFWRAEGGRERGKAGAGLGLAIVAAIVDAHDGTVSASNAPGGGAQFVIELPAAAD